MQNLKIRTQGIRGGKHQYKNNIGEVIVFLNHEEDKIKIDYFQGQGQDYKQRETEEIQVYDNGEMIFFGSKRELFEKLKSI
jgi:hypothetical protein